jgi:hypothetical protein
MSKINPDFIKSTPTPSSEILGQGTSYARQEEEVLVETARIIGQPEGPFGTAVCATQTLLMRSLGAARYSKFETLEIARHGLFAVCQNTSQNPYQAKTTLLELQLFLGNPSHPNTPNIKAIARIEEIKTAVDVPQPTPAGYVLRLLQVQPEDSAKLERFINEHLLRTAI